MSAYFDALTEAMNLCSDRGAYFVGQSVLYGGQAMSATFTGTDPFLLKEFPVAEDFQLGYCTGLALTGQLVVSVFPRVDFLLCAANQLVNHLDKATEMGWGNPKVIIRTAVGARYPLDAGPQHTQDHTSALRELLANVRVVVLTQPDQIVDEYARALERDGSTVLIEHAGLY